MKQEGDIEPIHVAELLAAYHIKVLGNSTFTCENFCDYLHSTLSPKDIDLLGENGWKIEFVGTPSGVSAGAKRYEDVFPFFQRYASSNNCYSFALDDLRGERSHKAVPGNLAGIASTETWQLCAPAVKLIEEDNKTVKKLRNVPDSEAGHIENIHDSNMHAASSRKLPGTYQVALFVDAKRPDGSKRAPDEITDFHWYREMRCPRWLGHYLEHHDTDSYRQTKFPVEILKNMTRDVMKEYMGRDKNVPPQDGGDDVGRYHGIASYYNTNRGENTSTTKTGSKYAVWANKAGWSDILTIISPKGRVMLDPESAVRGYGGDIDYDKACTRFVVKTNEGQTSP